MASELVNLATSEKLKEMDWTRNIEICELVASDHRQARDVIKAIKKRLGSKNLNSQLFAVMLLEMLMNNCGDHIHQQVIETGLLPILVKIVKKKTNLPVREKIFLLLDATQTSLGGASGKFPQYYAAYYDLVCARVQFPQCPPAQPADQSSEDANLNNLPSVRSVPPKLDSAVQQPVPQSGSDSSIILKATAAMDVLREVLDAIDPLHPEGATDEFTLDLVEQCSFQKQRVVHLVMVCRDEKVVSQAIELNDKLDKLLAKHDALLSVRATSDAISFNHEEAEEEEEKDQLFRRLRKGKACIQEQPETLPNLYGTIQGERLHRPLIRPLSIEPPSESNKPISQSAVAIPPPPAKHVEREKFFKEKQADGTALAGHFRGLSLHSLNGSSSRSGSIDFSD
ncbi:TOM1-like protein 5 isoform X2 [Aristolochia californica]|uniref:TOM1-like protein 5 isoform X2 n=1 Tax=Aristolochia californica TaxID=171875 RepID=UPI0035E1AE5F